MLSNKSIVAIILIIISSISVSAHETQGNPDGHETVLELPESMQKVLEYQQKIALSITFLVAFLGGILAFTSPCGFVVIPTFFSYLFKERKQALYMTAVFSAGMTVSFVIFGIIAGFAGSFFNQYKTGFAVFSGVMLIIFGIMLFTNNGCTLPGFRIKHSRHSAGGVFLLGMFFAAGWTPCIGPILGGIGMLAAGFGSILKSALLFGTYALGVALPLMIVSYLADKYDIQPWFTSRQVEIKMFGKTIYTHLYGIIGGAILVLIGIIMIYWRGTGFFMDTIPAYLPWTMSFFTLANQKAVESPLLTGIAGNIAGIAVILVVLYVLFRSYRK